MPPSKSRPSVAAELVLALSKPKPSDSTKNDNVKIKAKASSASKTPHRFHFVQESQSEEVASSRSKDQDKIFSPDTVVKGSNGNGSEDGKRKNWINFLKTKQDTPPVATSNKVSRKSPSPLLANNTKSSSQNHIIRKVKDEPEIKELSNDLNKKKKLPSNHNHDQDGNKDKVLKSLMDQVSSLESTLGEKISKLEANLKTERSKCKQLESALEREMKGYNEATAKCLTLSSDKEDIEKELRSKIEILSESLGEEKRKGSQMASEFAKFKVNSLEQNKLKEAELLEIQRENDEVHARVNSLTEWKNEMKQQVSKSVDFCRKNHTQKLQVVIDENLKLRTVIKEAKTKFDQVMADMSDLISRKEAEISILKGSMSITKSKEVKYLADELAKSEDKVVLCKSQLKTVQEELSEAQKEIFSLRDSKKTLAGGTSILQACKVSDVQGSEEGVSGNWTDVEDEIELNVMEQSSEDWLEVASNAMKKRKRGPDSLDSTEKKKMKHQVSEDDEIECVMEIRPEARNNNECVELDDDDDGVMQTKAKLRDVILNSLSRNLVTDERIIRKNEDVMLMETPSTPMSPISSAPMSPISSAPMSPISSTPMSPISSTPMSPIPGKGEGEVTEKNPESAAIENMLDDSDEETLTTLEEAAEKELTITSIISPPTWVLRAWPQGIETKERADKSEEINDDNGKEYTPRSGREDMEDIVFTLLDKFESHSCTKEPLQTCEEIIEDCLDLSMSESNSDTNEVDVDMLYGDLDIPVAEDAPKVQNIDISESMHSSAHSTSFDLNESMNSVDSNTLVIDFDKYSSDESEEIIEQNQSTTIVNKIINELFNNFV